MAAVSVTDYEARALRLTDDELVEEFWAAIDRLDDDHHEEADRLYQLLQELMDRVAPELSRRSTERLYRDHPNAQAEIAASLKAAERRAKARAAYAAAVRVVDPHDLTTERESVAT